MFMPLCRLFLLIEKSVVLELSNENAKGESELHTIDPEILPY